MMNINDLFDSVFNVNERAALPTAASATMPTTSTDQIFSSSTDVLNTHFDDYIEFENRPITREIMSHYLSTRQHRTVTIFHAKVAQKSYGNEKRFFCPPPCVYLSGDGWNSSFDRNCCSSSSVLSAYSKHEQLSVTIGISESLLSHTNENSLSNEMQNLSLENGKRKYGSAKTLFISDSDKRKYIHISVKLLYNNNYHSNQCIGLFESRKLKVISKPSKKKQSVKNAESVCIQSGTKIALFNRLRSQNVSTRFLHVNENNQFHASAHEWGSFYIHLVDADESTYESNEFLVKEGFIHYGSTVKLVCSMTNQSLPYMIIRKVDKNRLLLDSDEPVSQLHKCAFEFKNSAPVSIYLSLLNERIVGVEGKKSPNEHFRVDISDSASWTIISTDKAEYTWFEAKGPVSNPITPVPVACNIVIDGGGTIATIKINGENFSPGLSVWFGEIESPNTEYQSNQVIFAEVPHVSSLLPNASWIQRTISTPILFVRRDGVIYLTPLVFSYTPQLATVHTVSMVDDNVAEKTEDLTSLSNV